MTLSAPRVSLLQCSSLPNLKLSDQGSAHGSGWQMLDYMLAVLQVASIHMYTHGQGQRKWFGVDAKTLVSTHAGIQGKRGHANQCF